MKRFPLLLACAILFAGLAATLAARAATFPIDYSDPASDVVLLNSTTNLCEVDAGNACILSPDPSDVNILWLRGRDGITAYNLTIEVKGRIRDYANTSYMVNFYADPTNQTHWIVNYTNGGLLLYTNATGAGRTDISGNATIWGPNPGNPNSLSMFVNKTFIGPLNATAEVNLDGTAIMRGDPSAGQPHSFQDFGWEVPGHPASSPTLLQGHVYEQGTTTPVAGATVTIAGYAPVTTNATGFYSISLSPGTYNVMVSAPGFDAQTFSVTLAAGQALTRDVGLDRTGLGGALANYTLPIAVILLALVLILIILLARRRRKRPAEPA